MSQAAEKLSRVLALLINDVRAHLATIPIGAPVHFPARPKTNWEIGTILGISSRTVQTHLDRIFRKLGVEIRAAAVACAFTRSQLAGEVFRTGV